MRTIAVLPIKSFGAGKQRLGAALRGGSRNLLAQAMFFDVLSSLRRARRVDAVAVVTDDHEIAATLRGDPVTVLADEAAAGQSAAARVGIRHAVSAGFERVLLVPGDTPLVDAGAIDDLLDGARAHEVEVAIVPDRHREGTNALVISPPAALDPSFGPGSLGRHLEAARAAGLTHRVEEIEPLMHDVDTPEDLAALSEMLEGRRGVAPRTRGALRQFDRLQLRAATEALAAPVVAGDGEATEGQPLEPAATWRPTRESAPADRRAAWA